MSGQKLIIDTDPGDDVDDVLALAFALLRPELDVRAITTVTPFSDRRVHIVRKLLRTLRGDDHGVSVAAGMRMPLRRVETDEAARMTDNGGYVLNHYPWVTPEEEAREAPVDEDAAGLIIRTVNAHDGEAAVVCIGPTTNLAVALRREPEIAGRIRWIAIMGGEVHLNRAEHNVAWDPHAAEIVLTAGIPLFLGTWDVTRRFVLTPEDCDLLRRRGTPLTDALSRCIDLWSPHKGGKPGPVMYDLAPILWSLDRGTAGYYETRPMRVHVETRGEWTRGMTVVRHQGPANAEVTVDMRADLVRGLYLETVLA